MYRFQKKFNKNSGEERDKAPRGPLKYVKDVSLRLILMDKGGNRLYVHLPFCLSSPVG